MAGRGAPREILRVGARFGARYREAGWGPGLSILTAMANVLPALGPDERPLALFHGLVRVAEDCAGQPPRFDLPPLPSGRAPAGPAQGLVPPGGRGARHRRRRAGAPHGHRRRGAPGAAVADVLFAAATDHYFLDAGHTLDFVTKAFELLDHVGWGEAPAILPSLVGGLCRAERSEERSAWRRPIDLPALLEPAFEELASLPRGWRSRSWPTPPSTSWWR